MNSEEQIVPRTYNLRRCFGLQRIKKGVGQTKPKLELGDSILKKGAEGAHSRLFTVLYTAGLWL